MKPLAILILMLPFAAVSSPAQTAKTQFQPGEWQTDSTVTPSLGKPLHRTITVCANQSGDFWNRPQPGQQCDAPQVTAIANGYNVKLHCSGSAGPVQWKMDSSINETFAANGNTFQATGTTNSQTILPGRPPMQASATILSTGKRIGPCTAQVKPVQTKP